MILVGSQRGGAGDLARHLLKEENEHVLVHEVRGFAAEDLYGAFKEVEATARGTQCQKFLFSLSLNAPPGERATTEDYEQAISKVEAKLGLANQPRVIVFHEKDGRRHCHAVWSRIDAEEMKAIPLSYSKLKLQELSRELFLQHEWTMPRGLLHSKDRDPRNLTLQEWQQAKRTEQ
ncbi:MAG: relaxase/mobilization nuclease domain-containing protein, partial [Pseudomonadota bacterium]